MKDKIVCVEWEDASSNSGFYDKRRPEDFEPVLTKTVGYFIKKTKKGIIVSQERFYDSKGKPNDDRHIVTIPKKMIRRVAPLKEVE